MSAPAPTSPTTPRWASVLGASSGIGAGVARAMAAGVHVCVDRDDWLRLVPPGFELQSGVEPASRQRISGLIESADAAWFW